MLDVVDHSLPVEGVLLRVREVPEFSIKLVEFRSQFLPPELQFTKCDELRLVGIQQSLILSFEALAALLQLRLLGRERRHVLLFRLCPRVVEVRQDRRMVK